MPVGPEVIQSPLFISAAERAMKPPNTDVEPEPEHGEASRKRGVENLRDFIGTPRCASEELRVPPLLMPKLGRK